ncbi:hypothetical protein [Kitasatospora sp. SUK 42]|uniref:hypothetical protein n=1 Tax=Kitasatospora sp. SUK 42 TaxID=1588882 RepID=UPI0018C9FB53|nr:hypothetical protein [Kitasatospora sp. SUK 42]MBV2153318.1 hypothetical protein [Kitasatospora sp. SUK 42]
METKDDDKPGDSAAGPAGRISAALDRRGFTTRALRVRAWIAAAVVVATAVGLAIGGWVLLRDDMTNDYGPKSVCDGVVNSRAVNDVLGSGKVSAEPYEGNVSRGTAVCAVTVAGGMFGDDRTVMVSLDQSKDVFHLPFTPGARTFAASANGGAVGAVRGSEAWALLPEGCPNGLWARVTVYDKKQPDALKFARLAVSTADRIADRRGCGRAPLPTLRELTPAAAERELDGDAVCGLPGITVQRAPGKRYKEAVTAGSDPLWTCEITPEGDHEGTSSLVIATEPRLRLDATDRDTSPAFGRARWVGPIPRDEIVVTCHDRPVYFRIRTIRQLGYLFDTSDETWKQFLAAGGKAIGCEPIL